MTTKNQNRWTRRDFLGTVAGAAAAASLPGALHAAIPAPGKRPMNVLFLMSDDMRVELGCYGSMFHALTPNLDALAKSGVRFDHNYCQFPLCNPSRASLLTGRNPTRTSVLGNRTDFRVAHPDWTTLPQLFRQNGYVTVRAGKIYHGGIDDAKSWNATSDKGGPTDDGSGPAVGHNMVIPRVQIPQPDGVLPPLPADNARSAYSDRIIVLDGNGEGHGDYHTADRTIENLQKYKDQPFFIACGFVKPHSPPTAPQKFFDLYDVDKIKLTPDFAAWPTVPPGFPAAAIRPRNADLFIGRGASEAEAKEVIRAYIASISWVDWNVGRVIAELDRLGLRDNTIIVFAVRPRVSARRKGQVVQGRLAVRDGHARAADDFRSRRERQRSELHPHRGVAGHLSDAGGVVRLAETKRNRRHKPRAAAAPAVGPVGQAGLQRLERGRENAARHCRSHRAMALRRVRQGRRQRRDAVRPARRPARK